ncbi:hypothetical protein [Streptomyces rhizosphaerihabitans]|uniref:hypothetical protein n=1 Tax=Streptomyces rhizosphaerihabitans TaxID=1266770 RepID=UPI0021C1F63C|nr:hypothetical protein [Streptomyces rhizosphaerihabitans]MCT9004642.1 hypothetical protein [Streptomyces rhizosphaerihabitans]
MDASTSQERMDRWKSLLSGQDSKGARGAALRRSGPVNLLTGVWLHAAARAEQGLELTGLERSILEPLQRVLGEGEVSAVGRLYREQRGEEGLAVALVPQAVTSRSLQQGYGLEEYRAALTELLPQIMAMPNMAVVDRDRLAAGEGIDTPEFTAALAEYGYGVTGFTGAGDDEASDQAVAPFRARLEWGGFHCYEAAGDQGGGRDEIYWTCASNATDYQHTTRTGPVLV